MVLDRTRRGVGRFAACALAAGIMVGGVGVESADGATWNFDDGISPAPLDDATRHVATSIGVVPRRIFNMQLSGQAGEPIVAIVPIDGERFPLVLQPHSLRADNYQVLVQGEDGRLVRVQPGIERTYRGALLGAPENLVAASLLEDGLHVRIDMGDEQYWIEPIGGRVPNAAADEYILYRSGDTLGHPGTCGVPDAVAGKGLIQDHMLAEPRVAQGGGLCVAELALDADFEYFQDYGSVANTEARMSSVINTVNLQYESQTGITHQITTMIVRTSSNDPYTSTDAQTRLCQFITEWTNNQGGVQRDVAHLFTGAELNGSTIGIAADIGDTGICVNSGGCSGGTFGTFGSYCLSQSDFNGNFSCATDLTAHELGHLWGAFHCSCSGNTMNSSITCANQFSAGTINSISAYRDTRTCLTGSCDGPAGPENDDCADAIPFNGGAGDGIIAYSTVGATTDGPTNPSGQCNDFGQNQTHNDIWFSYTATCDGDLTITTCDDLHNMGDPTYDTDLVLYTGNCNNLNLIACNDDDPVNGCGTSSPYSSTIQVTGVTSGTTFLIRVGGWSSSDSGSGFLMVDCQGTAPATGACCFADGSCNVLTQADCNSQGGTYQGNNVTCAAANCPQPTGACCFSDGSCSVETAADCSSLGGTYQGDGVTCAAANCAQPTGACCFSDGSCTTETAADCASAGGTYQGDGTNCGTAGCPQPTGACCFADGSCSLETAADCGSLGGTYQGDNITCAAANCPQPTGACCYSDGTCSVETAADCASFGGTYQGDNVTCAAANCPQPTGACCYSDGSCSEETAADCASFGGTYQGDGTDCGSANCGGGSATIESGSLVVGGGYSSVSFSGSFTNPVVVCTIEYSGNAEPVVARVSNVGPGGFDVRLQTPDGSSVANELVSWIAIEEGVYDIGGVRFEAASFLSTVTARRGNWGQATSRAYQQSYSNPVVLGQVMSENDARWSTFFSRGGSRQSPPSSSDLRVGKHVAEDPDFARADEVVGYIVFEAGSGSLGGVSYEAALGGDSIRGIDNNPPYSYSHGLGVTPAVAIASQSAMDGNDGSWAYIFGVPSASSLPLTLDEDTLSNGERRHTTEQVAYLIFSGNVSIP